MSRLARLLYLISVLFVSGWGVDLLMPDVACAQVLISRDRGEFSIQNQSAFNLIQVRWGTQSIHHLSAGDTWRVAEVVEVDLLDEKIPFQLYGMIEYAQWGTALDVLPGSEAWARLQLSTAGFDVHKGSKISQLESERRRAYAIRTLSQLASEHGRNWVKQGKSSPLKFALLAYAARYAPVESLLEPLLEQIHPESSQERSLGWPEGYEGLPRAVDSLRYAISVHGARALPIVLKFPKWARDQGFGDEHLAFALIPDEQVIDALKARGDLSQVERLLQQLESERDLGMQLASEGLLMAKKYLSDFKSARSSGNQAQALKSAIHVTLMWRRHLVKVDHSQTVWTLCNYFNEGAQRAISEKLILAAQAYLNLGKDVCLGHSFYRAIVAEFMRIRGDLSDFDQRLSDALPWYRAAVWFHEELIDRVRLIDTLSRLAINHVAHQEVGEAQKLLKEARRLETPEIPIRPLLAAASRLIPTPDRRGQVGLIFLAALLAIGAFSALMRVIFSRKS